MRGSREENGEKEEKISTLSVYNGQTGIGERKTDNGQTRRGSMIPTVNQTRTRLIEANQISWYFTALIVNFISNIKTHVFGRKKTCNESLIRQDRFVTLDHAKMRNKLKKNNEKNQARRSKEANWTVWNYVNDERADLEFWMAAGISILIGFSLKKLSPFRFRVDLSTILEIKKWNDRQGQVHSGGRRRHATIPRRVGQICRIKKIV